MKQDHDMRPPIKGDRGPKKERTLAEIAETVWLTPENAVFYHKNGLLYLSQSASGEETPKEQRVLLLRQFPFDLLWEYISVMSCRCQMLCRIKKMRQIIVLRRAN